MYFGMRYVAEVLRLLGESNGPEENGQTCHDVKTKQDPCGPAAACHCQGIIVILIVILILRLIVEVVLYTLVLSNLSPFAIPPPRASEAPTVTTMSRLRVTISSIKELPKVSRNGHHDAWLIVLKGG